MPIMNTQNTEPFRNMLELIKVSLYGGTAPEVTGRDFEELKNHTVAALAAPVLSSVRTDPDTRREWKKAIIQQVTGYEKNKYEQEQLPVSVPYVILKGTSAAQYYPYPEYRAVGDIDIMTRREDFTAACESLLRHGYREVTRREDAEFGRHRSFSKNGIEIEIHAFFALLNDPRKTEWMDSLIIRHINPSHVLPDDVNGLVLLEHIDQHLESGLGLRQIIDWMMFVNRCLPDEQWPAFEKMTEKIGLRQLALVTTRMSEIYLGLPAHRFCEHIDPAPCGQLMEYVLQCGNFGSKQKNADEADVKVLTYARTPAAILRHLQARGLMNWDAAQRHPVLRPAAWLYQVFRYLRTGFRKAGRTDLKSSYETAKERVALFDSLGVTQASKGLAVYKNDEYTRTYQRP